MRCNSKALQGDECEGVDMLELLHVYGITSLEVLLLADNRLSEVSASVSRLEALLRLDLRRNLLTSLPTEIGQVTKLTQLNLSQNRLRVIPSEIGQLVHLAELHLDQNQLKFIPDSFGLLKALSVLRLDQNQLTVLPSTLGGLVSLTEFSVRDNYLREVPAELGQLLLLTYLGLGYDAADMWCISCNFCARAFMFIPSWILIVVFFWGGVALNSRARSVYILSFVVSLRLTFCVLKAQQAE